ncbi:MAG: hypothetical protein R3358_03695 [Woeseiaceae bacterium]|nr:hypothetical protein [Woeseiaceae bacterium]
MSRSPLAYPLTRGIDADSGGAADLQTDIMRFMAILALCLVAIFALVQSLPMQPVAPPDPATVAQQEPPPETQAPRTTPEPRPAAKPAAAAPPDSAQRLVLTRPQWVSTFQPQQRIEAPQTKAQPAVAKPPAPVVADATVTQAEQQGFTLRFESDLALTRLVASGQVGFYAIGAGRAQRMSVADSRIAFWDASTPNAFHEMEAATVPAAVVDALRRSGADTAGVDWGVTLPGKLSRQLETLMREHTGGSLVIRSNGNLELEAT